MPFVQIDNETATIRHRSQQRKRQNAQNNIYTNY
nr:MAG TPA: hypothetical protein [Caudoviricetes sp.]